MASKIAATFRLEDDILEAMLGIKDTEGILITVQVRKALEMWFGHRAGAGGLLAEIVTTEGGGDDTIPD